MELGVAGQGLWGKLECNACSVCLRSHMGHQQSMASAVTWCICIRPDSIYAL